MYMLPVSIDHENLETCRTLCADSKYIFFEKYVNVFYVLLFFVCTHVRFTKTHRSFIWAITFDWFAYFENGKKPAQADIKNYMLKKKKLNWLC